MTLSFPPMAIMLTEKKEEKKCVFNNLSLETEWREIDWDKYIQLECENDEKLNVYCEKSEGC